MKAVYLPLDVISTILGLAALGLAAGALRLSRQADPKGLRTDFRRIETEWDNTYEKLEQMMKRFSKREERARVGNGASDGSAAPRSDALNSDADVMALARQRGIE